MATQTAAPKLALALLSEERRRRRLQGAAPPPSGPPLPAQTVYHAGKQQYQLVSLYQNSGLPRRCRSGSGVPSYSTRKPADVPASAVPAPIAGAFAPHPAESSAAFRAARAELSLPVRMRNTQANAAPSIEWTTPPCEVDVQAVLPLLLEGVRDTAVDGRFVATQGAAELIAAAGPSGKLLRVSAYLVEPLRLALATFDPPVVCAALQLLRQLLCSHRLSGAALRPHYRQLLPRMAPLVLRGQERQLRDGSDDRAADRQMNPSDLVADVLAEMESRGGSGAGAEIKACVPSWRPSEEPLHRGFVAPVFRNGDRVRLAQGAVLHSSGASAPCRGQATGVTMLHGLAERVGETVNLAVHGRPRLVASFVNPAKKTNGW